MILINYFKDENNKDTLLHIFNQENIDNFIRTADIKKQSDINDNKQNNNSQNEKINKSIQNNNIYGTTYNNSSIISNDNKLNKQNNSGFQSLNNVTKSTMSFSKNTNNEKSNIVHDKTTLQYYEIIERLFNNSKFKINFNKGKEPFEIIFPDNGTKLYYQTFESITKHFKEKNTTKNDLVDNYFLLNDFLNKAKNILEEEIINKDNLNIEMVFEKKDNNNTSEEKKIIHNISVTYVFYPPNSQGQTLKFKDDNILINMTSSYSQALYYLIQEINDKKYINIIENSTKEESIKSNLSIDENKIDNKSIDDNSKDESNKDATKIIKSNKKNVIIKADKMKILEFNRIIGRHQEKKKICSANFIMELSNGYLVSGGTDNILMLYEPNGEILPGKMGRIDGIKDWTYSVIERMYYENRSKDLVQFICCSNRWSL